MGMLWYVNVMHNQIVQPPKISYPLPGKKKKQQHWGANLPRMGMLKTIPKKKTPYVRWCPQQIGTHGTLIDERM